MIAESRQTAGILAPVGEHLHPQVEVHLLADERFDLLARALPDFLDLGALTSDDDGRLAVALDINYRANVERGAAFAIFLDLDGDRAD